MKIRPVVKFVVAGFLLLFILFLWTLPVAIEYYLEKNDRELIGREIEIDDLDLNLFTGKLAFKNVTLFENDNRTPFISLGSVQADIRMLSLPGSVYELEYLSVNNWFVRLVQEGEHFNFDDLVEYAQTSDTETNEDEPVTYILRNIEFINGSFDYEDKTLQSLLQLDGIGITVPLLSHESSGLDYRVMLDQKEGGSMALGGRFDWTEGTLLTRFTIQSWKLNPYQNYLNSYLNISYFGGDISMDGNLHVSFLESEKLATSGTAELRDFLLVDNETDSLIQIERFMMSLDSVNTGENIYQLGHAEIERPSILFKYFKDGDNFTRLYLDSASENTLDTVTVASEEIVFENPFQYISEYIYYFLNEEMLNTFEMDSVRMAGGNIVFQDYSHLEDAIVVLDNIDLSIDRVGLSDSTINFNFTSSVNQGGELYGNMRFIRSNLANYIINFDLQNFYISSFDPYSKHYTAHPLWEGNLNVTSSTSVSDNYLTSKNKLLILEPQVGKKLDLDAEYKVPLRFAFGLLKDVEGNVDLEVPIEGNLDDPEYKLGKVIMKVLLNILSKAVASPYKLLARTLDADEEDLKAIRFGINQDSLAQAQLKSMNLLVRVLENKEDLVARLEYMMDEKKEREAIALTFAKNEFWTGLSDSLKTKVYGSPEGVDTRDSLFVNYLDQTVGGLGTSSAAQMSISLMGEQKLEERISYLRERHMELVTAYLLEEKMLDPERVELVVSDDPAKIAAVPRPTFMILFDAADYNQPDMVDGPSPDETDLAPE